MVLVNGLVIVRAFLPSTYKQLSELLYNSHSIFIENSELDFCCLSKISTTDAAPLCTARPSIPALRPTPRTWLGNNTIVRRRDSPIRCTSFKVSKVIKADGEFKTWRKTYCSCRHVGPKLCPVRQNEASLPCMLVLAGHSKCAPKRHLYELPHEAVGP